jgi:large subunit ribosomal protein L22
MRLRADKVVELAKAKNVSVEQLAGAVERTGLMGERAISAIGNWVKGRDHPRCKKTDMDKIAVTLGVPTREIARYTSEIFNHRGSPRKAKLLVDLIRNRPVLEAENLLRFNAKRAAVNVKKCLMAAYAEAQINQADQDRLVVSEARCDDGPRIKRFQPKDRGRAHPIIKRMSHITITLEERA